MNYTIIILGVVVIILLYVLYKYFSTNASVISPLASLKLANVALPMPSTAGSANYSYNVWVFVNTWDTTNLKPIFSRIQSTGTPSVVMTTLEPSATVSVATATATIPANSPQIALYLDKTTPTLKCFIHNAHATTASSTDPITITSNFPIQSWVYVTISVQGQYVDLYLQGKLVKSIQLAGVANVPSPDATVQLGTGTAGPDINVAGFTYYPNALTPQQVWSNYLAGNGQNTLGALSTYGVNVGLTSNGVAQNTFKLF